MKNIHIVLIVVIVVVAGGLLVWGNKTEAPTTPPEGVTSAMPVIDGSASGTVNEMEVVANGQVATKKHMIAYTENGFVPESIEVNAGDTVVFENKTDNAMWVASAIHPTHELYAEFDQKASVLKGGVYEFVFTKVGTWKYHNHANAGRKGTIIVK